MALIDALLERVADESLRHALREQVDLMLTKQSFGLVFQQHKPETVELHNFKVRRGCKVRIKAEEGDDLYLVDDVQGGVATIASLSDEPEYWSIEVEALVVVREFGDPIYAGLKKLGGIERGGDKPPHLVMNAENFHALETLLYTHAGKVDAIYIDPPYNNREKTWKYNNDYVDPDDYYRHSKWLAMMQRRLKLAKSLLNPDNSVLAVTIDEKEAVRLGMLLEKIFEGSKVQMITTVISAKGTMRRREFSRVAEHIFIVLIGEAAVTPFGPNMLDEGITEESGEPVDWLQLRRREPSSTRASRKGQFYPIFAKLSDGSLHSIGDALDPQDDRHKVRVPRGTFAVWPLNKRGKEMVWGLTPKILRERAEDGHFRLRNYKPDKGTVSVQYLPGGVVEGLASGRIHVVGRDEDGAVQAMYGEDVRGALPKTVWNMESHNAESYGTNLLTKLIPDRRFDYPKSLHAVEDTVRFFVGDKPDAVVLDFFGGSGTTLHAVARLNQLDGGRRQCILVTNNEVSDAEATALRADDVLPGDPEWEALGVCNYITIPRITAAFTGRTPDGDEVNEDYKFNGEYPIGKGLDQNVEFFELTYENRDFVAMGRRFETIDPLLWLRAGGRGPRVGSPNGSPWVIPDNGVYGVLFDLDRWREFVDGVRLSPAVTTAYIVADSEAAFQQVAAELPDTLCVQLYDDYLRSFEINTAGRS